MAAQQLLLINPRRRKKARKSSRSRRRSHSRRRRHVARRIIKRVARRRRRNPVFRIRRRRHRNPMSLNVSGIKHAIMPAAIGAIGAIGLDVAYGYLGQYIPASISGNKYLSAAVKLGGAYGIGVLAGKFMGREKGRAVMLGAMTVVSYGIIKGLLAASGVPGLSGFGAYMPMSGMNPAAYLDNGSSSGGFPGVQANPVSFGAYMPMGGGTQDDMFQ